MSIFQRDWRICMATGCNQSRKRTQILCMSHWESLPRRIKLEVINAIIDRGGMGGEVEVATRKAISHIEVREGHLTEHQASILEDNIRERVRREESTRRGNCPPSVG